MKTPKYSIGKDIAHLGIEQQLKVRIRRARAGDVDDAQWLLKEFVAAVNDTRASRGRATVMRERLLRYIADCLQEILRGKEPRRALGIARPSRRPTGTHTTDYVRLVGLVADEITKALGSMDSIYQRVADANRVAKNTVKAAFSKPERWVPRLMERTGKTGTSKKVGK